LGLTPKRRVVGCFSLPNKPRWVCPAAVQGIRGKRVEEKEPVTPGQGV